MAPHPNPQEKPALTDKPMGPRKRPSLIDVARVAGVAPITVSRVANAQDTVRESTRKKVLDAMAQVGYQPNTAARALATGRFGTIGVITFTMATYGNARTVAATLAAAERQGYAVTLLTAPSTSQDEVHSAVARLKMQAVDGVIVIVEARLLGGEQLSLPPGIPIVVADSGGASEFCVVDSDQAGGARLATEHLLSLGHRNVWHISGPARSFAAAARAKAWRESLRAAGIRPPRVLGGDWTTRSGYRHGKTLAADPSVTAIFAANDQMALGAMRALHEAGRSIPGEVSVVGFDDMEDSDSFWPPLTTVRQNFDEIGRLCVDSLLEEIRHHTGALRTHIVPTSLVVRQSTAPPPPA
ncbi:LacI family DNA-binding transcriptional regulator [Nonomuraea sp. SYSU D8015]|uniref:LacI family DNA-binding transcriptional regulator n=1 Tax=Nonomuraea sp. SYSU D8015 TaxID=2593644 RepID=UPI001CB6BCE8|nr:LacI family DNA-binding transcriptional regulator [Nonomuraea sp. SYSU D8015]